MELPSHPIQRILLALLLLPLSPALARNVDLSTVPRRDSVSLTIYNSEDLTLVRETRTITFKKGPNPLQFSWANTLIDPTSVKLNFLSAADKLDLADTTFPHDKPQMLYWNVTSEFDGPATVEITYFTSGISWSADYLCIADKDETQMSFEGFVRVFNNSGEEYEDAQIRLVVGTINLVEKIAQLARIPVDQLKHLSTDELRSTFTKSGTGTIVLSGANSYRGGTVISGGSLQFTPKEIAKESLSDYFLYSIEGTETIKTGWSKRLRSFEGKTVPFKIQYRYRLPEYGDQLVRMYILTNDKPSKLGTTPLPNGIVRVFRNNARDGLSYLAQQTIKYVPIGDKIELNLGPDPSVIFELIKLKTWRDNLWLQVNGTSIFRRADQPGLQIEVNSSIVGWDDHQILTQRLRNYTPKPIDVEIRRTFPGHIVFRSALNPTLHDYQTVQFTATIPPTKKSDLLFELTKSQGRNAKQSNITLEPAQISP